MFPALRPLLAAAAQHELGDRFSKEEIGRITRTALDDYGCQRPLLPDERGGARVMLNLAALAIGLYRALFARVGEREARRHTANVTWRLYRSMMAVPTAVAAITTPPGPQRLRRATELVRRYPFGAPGYQVADSPPTEDSVAFQVLRCPVADYFRSQGLSDLCAEAFCDLECRLAEEWNATLVRSGTIAGGAGRCDFRWHLAGPGGGHGR